MDNAKRWVAGQALHLAVCMMMHPNHELMRVGTVHAEGLTPKEEKFLNQRLALIQSSLADLAKLSNRVRTTTGEFKRHGG